MVRGEPARRRRRHHWTPSRAQAIWRPSMHQDAWRYGACEGCGCGAACGPAWSTRGMSSSTRVVSAIMRPTVRPAMSGWARRRADPQRARIGMGLLAMRPLPHPGQPALARGRLRAAFFVQKPGTVLGLTPRDPGRDGRPGHRYKAPDTELVPALIVEVPDRASCRVALGMGRGGPELERRRRGHGTWGPKEWRGLGIEGRGARAEPKARQCPIMQAVREGCTCSHHGGSSAGSVLRGQTITHRVYCKDTQNFSSSV